MRLKDKIKLCVIGAVAIVAILLVVKISKDVRSLLDAKETNENPTTQELVDGGNENQSTTENVNLPLYDRDYEAWIAEFETIIEGIKTQYPEGMFYNSVGVSNNDEENPNSQTGNVTSITTSECNHELYGTKYCNEYHGKSNDAYPYAVAGRRDVGFASMISDLIFGKEAEAYIYYEYDDIKVGDQARINNDSYTVIILEKTDDHIIVGGIDYETNICRIMWEKKIKKNELSSAFYVSRYRK